MGWYLSIGRLPGIHQKSAWFGILRASWHDKNESCPRLLDGGYRLIRHIEAGALAELILLEIIRL